LIDPRGYHLPFLEWMVTTSCDLACPGCDRFIDYDHRWHEEFEEMKSNMTAWSKRLDPDNFTIIGGEPLIHPNIYEILEHSRKCFDHARIEIYSNGFFLPKRDKLLQVLIDTQPSKLSITLHNREQSVRDLVQKNIEEHIIKDHDWEEVKFGLWRYQDVELEITDPTQGGWYDYRQTINGVLKPWKDNQPEQSYIKCSANIYPIIFKNRLYKCPPISMLETHANKYGLKDDVDWEPYLKYKGLSIDCSEYELQGFVHNISEPHPICNMCPANPQLKPQEEAVLKGKIHEM
jgi:organic radical activating enzyme